MSNFDNTNRGSIWGNKEKTKESQPDFKGSINIEGREYWLSGWRRKPNANPNAPAVSFSVEPKDKQGYQQQPVQQQYQTQPSPMANLPNATQQMQQQAVGVLDDDIPFMRLDSF